jgi:hypothetical protein
VVGLATHHLAILLEGEAAFAIADAPFDVLERDAASGASARVAAGCENPVAGADDVSDQV